MEISSNSNLAFQARIPLQVKQILKGEASEYGSKVTRHLNNKIRQVESWGDKNSELVAAYDLDAGNISLGLNNKIISQLYGSNLPESKKGILSSFMKLKKRDIHNAESELKQIVKNNQQDLINKALKNKTLMKKITGNENSSLSELKALVSEMPEQKVCDLRFGLDEHKSPSNEIMLDFIL